MKRPFSKILKDDEILQRALAELRACLEHFQGSFSHRLSYETALNDFYHDFCNVYVVEELRIQIMQYYSNPDSYDAIFQVVSTMTDYEMDEEADHIKPYLHFTPLSHCTSPNRRHYRESYAHNGFLREQKQRMHQRLSIITRSYISSPVQQLEEVIELKSCYS